MFDWYWYPGTRTWREGDDLSPTEYTSSSSSEDDTDMSFLLRHGDGLNIEGDLTSASVFLPMLNPPWSALLYTRMVLWKFFLPIDERKMDLGEGEEEGLVLSSSLVDWTPPTHLMRALGVRLPRFLLSGGNPGDKGVSPVNVSLRETCGEYD